MKKANCEDKGPSCDHDDYDNVDERCCAADCGVRRLRRDCPRDSSLDENHKKSISGCLPIIKLILIPQ